MTQHTRVRFYFNVAGYDSALRQLLGKAWRYGLTVGVLTESAPACQALDRMLWEEPNTGFLPHCLAGSPVAAQTTIWLAHQLDALHGRQVLFNRSGQDVLPGFAGEQLVELVARGDEEGAEQARQRVRRYRQAGYEVEFTDMATHHG
ncbi:DNA polymerase III subunit chi [Chitinimonas sp.]|uniref:DNA polymerase III subunit chi n=1 Tax=Chitinimonas sp. TaxID=1934313 RepID=UPI0035B2D723